MRDLCEKSKRYISVRDLCDLSRGGRCSVCSECEMSKRGIVLFVIKVRYQEGIVRYMYVVYVKY